MNRKHIHNSLPKKLDNNFSRMLWRLYSHYSLALSKVHRLQNEEFSYSTLAIVLKNFCLDCNPFRTQYHPNHLPTSTDRNKPL